MCNRLVWDVSGSVIARGSVTRFSEEITRDKFTACHRSLRCQFVAKPGSLCYRIAA
jgi:hypothetical protein